MNKLVNVLGIKSRKQDGAITELCKKAGVDLRSVPILDFSAMIDTLCYLHCIGKTELAAACGMTVSDFSSCKNRNKARGYVNFTDEQLQGMANLLTADALLVHMKKGSPFRMRLRNMEPNDIDTLKERLKAAYGRDKNKIEKILAVFSPAPQYQFEWRPVPVAVGIVCDAAHLSPSSKLRNMAFEDMLEQLTAFQQGKVDDVLPRLNVHFDKLSLFLDKDVRRPAVGFTREHLQELGSLLGAEVYAARTRKGDVDLPYSLKSKAEEVFGPVAEEVPNTNSVGVSAVQENTPRSLSRNTGAQ